MTRTDAERIAAEKLPCEYPNSCGSAKVNTPHWLDCRALDRPQFVAAILDAYAEGERDGARKAFDSVAVAIDGAVAEYVRTGGKQATAEAFAQLARTIRTAMPARAPRRRSPSHD